MAASERSELPGGLLAQLREVVGTSYVRTRPVHDLSAYERDWSGRFVGRTPLVVAPADTAEVSAVLAACTGAGVAVVPRGGNTGLVNGGVPYGEMVLDLRRLTELAVDPLLGTVTAGAGVSVAAVQKAARAHGLRYGVDLASRDSATVGGTIATNAAGLRAVRLGDTRAQLLAVEAVLSSGAVLGRTGHLPREAGGYDLSALLCGSEGTLAVITTARLRLRPDPASRAVALLSFPDVDAAVVATGSLRREPAVEAIEFMLAAGVALVCAAFGLAAPFPTLPPALLLVEVTDATDAASALDRVVSGVNGMGESAVGMEAAEIRRLWAYRDLHTDAVRRVGVSHKLDVALPLDVLPQVLAAIEADVAAVWPAATLWVWGHLGEGNLHLNVTGIEAADEALDEVVLRRVAQAGGSISAEHGIGRAKARWLPLVRSATELTAWQELRLALDPAGTLNPGVLRADPESAPLLLRRPEWDAEAHARALDGGTQGASRAAPESAPGHAGRTRPRAGPDLGG
ncbi:MAG: FAD-binding oxidoreductase [Sporichthyaceae bacterium]